MTHDKNPTANLKTAACKMNQHAIFGQAQLLARSLLVGLFLGIASSAQAADPASPIAPPVATESEIDAGACLKPRYPTKFKPVECFGNPCAGVFPLRFAFSNDYV